MNNKKILAPELRFKGFSDDWEISPIEKILQGLIDCEHKTAPYIDDSEYLVVRTNNVRNGNLIYEDIKYTTKTGFEEWTKRAVPRYGDILLTREAPAGESCLVPKNKKICLGQRMVLLQPNDQKVDGPYLSYYLQSNSGIRNIDNVIIGTTVTRINIADIYKLKCPVTSLVEQQKIGSFLSSVDEKIQQFTRKKELLQQYKKGVMQQLFSGKLRFKDKGGKAFPKWEEKRLGDVGDTFNGLTGKTKENFGEGKPFIQYMQIFSSSKIDVAKCGLVQIDDNENQTRVQYGDVFFTTSSETPNEIGTCSVLLEEIEEMYLNSFCFGFRPNSLTQLVPNFASYLFRNEMFRKKIIKLAQGSTRYNMSKVQLLKLKVSLPSNAEQKKIANYLSSIVNKIEIINKQITQTQTFKKGLLQQMFV